MEGSDLDGCSRPVGDLDRSTQQSEVFVSEIIPPPSALCA